MARGPNLNHIISRGPLENNMRTVVLKNLKNVYKIIQSIIMLNAMIKSHVYKTFVIYNSTSLTPIGINKHVP